MGTLTPNMSIYVPANGEDNYGTSFLQGMMNVDQHDHSGGPNNGVPLSSAAIAPGAITRDKLNPNVVSPGGGLQIDISNPNALMVAGLLLSLYNLVTTGIIVNAGSGTAQARSLAAGAGILISNANGVLGNPNISVAGLLASIFGLASNGIIVNAGAGVAQARTITAGSGLAVTNGDGVAGNPVVGLSTYTPMTSFTPVITGSGSNPVAVYSQQTGYYSVINNLVIFSIQISASSTGGTGNFQVGSLPVASNATAGLDWQFPAVLTRTGVVNRCIGNLAPGANIITFYAQDAAPPDIANLPINDLTGIFVSGCYST